MKKMILLIGIALLQSGCETPKPNKSQAQFEQERISAQIVSANDKTKTCIDEAKTDVQVQRFYEEIIFEIDTSPNKFNLITKKEKINSEQKETLKQSVAVIAKCRQMMINGLGGTPFQTITLKYYNATDAIYIKMLKDEISIGDANEEKSKFAALHRTEWADTWTEINKRLGAMHDAEMQGRMQAAAAMMPLLMQQQQNQQFQQQMLYQQQMQNINNNRPILISPSTTNCTTYGNQTNCTTR